MIAFLVIVIGILLLVIYSLQIDNSYLEKDIQMTEEALEGYSKILDRLLEGEK